MFLSEVLLEPIWSVPTRLWDVAHPPPLKEEKWRLLIYFFPLVSLALREPRSFGFFVQLQKTFKLCVDVHLPHGDAARSGEALARKRPRLHPLIATTTDAMEARSRGAVYIPVGVSCFSSPVKLRFHSVQISVFTTQNPESVWFSGGSCPCFFFFFLSVFYFSLRAETSALIWRLNRRNTVKNRAQGHSWKRRGVGRRLRRFKRPELHLFFVFWAETFPVNSWKDIVLEICMKYFNNKAETWRNLCFVFLFLSEFVWWSRNWSGRTGETG